MGGANLATLADQSFADGCKGPTGSDLTTWFFKNGNPGGWTKAGTNTTGHTLGYGYAKAGSYYGKCSTGSNALGVYPGDKHTGTLASERQLVCACFHKKAP